jgi:hypothetical protein
MARHSIENIVNLFTVFGRLIVFLFLVDNSSLWWSFVTFLLFWCLFFIVYVVVSDFRSVSILTTQVVKLLISHIGAG